MLGFVGDEQLLVKDITMTHINIEAATVFMKNLFLRFC
jgi:hypothetical protein